NFLRISPVVKGVFNSPEEGYNPSKHWVGINCTIASSLINDFQKEVSVERITRPLNWPDITAIYNCETKENVIYTDFANHIAGDNLIMANYEINGIIIALKSDINQSILIGTNNLGVVSHKTKELTFTIRKNFASPVWLVKDEEVLIKIRYKNPEGYTRETDSLETRWGG
ncbi:MAG: hypothetical protein JXB50_13675, partial [Spirochaetes bacterium]|nr:hypothetical protein [Spirochaetota bacterium]